MVKESVRPRKQISDDARIYAHDTFPFSTRNGSIPTLGYALENLGISLASLAGSVGSLVVTALVFVPLGVYGSILQARHRSAEEAARDGDGSPPLSAPPKKVAVVTGASAGIGEATAMAMAERHLAEAPESMHLVLVLTGRSVERLEDTARALRALGPRVSAECRVLDQCDIGINDKAKAFVRAVVEKHGRIDVLVANAGISGHFEETAPGITPHSSQPADSWGLDSATRLTQTNVVGTVAVILAVWEHMREQSKAPSTDGRRACAGQIAVTGSSAALFGPPSFAVYSATKAYLYHFVQNLRQISFAHDIRVNLISPGFIRSSQTLSMLSTGGRMPVALLGDTRGMADAIVRGIAENRGVTLYPVHHNLPLFGCRALNPLCEEFGRWVATRADMVSNLIS